VTLHEALLSYKEFYRPSSPDETIQYYAPNTGPFRELVTCDYFIVRVRDSQGEEEYRNFQTSIDLYPEEILKDFWELYEK
jgi:hypothetical protein